MEEELYRGCDDQRQHHRDENAADHRNRQRLQHLRSLPDAERQRQHASGRRHGGHHDRAQASSAGVYDRLLDRHPLRYGLVVRVEQQDAVFGDDADDHDQPHERRHVEGGSRHQQRDEDTRGREQRRREDRDRRGVGPELEEEYQENQDDRQREHRRQVAKRLLLLAEGAAVLDANRWRQLQSRDRFLDR